MSLLPSIPKYITVEETQFEAPVSESTAQKLGGTNNFLLDHYPVQPGTLHEFAGPEANVPPGYIVCDGRTFNRTTEANLFAAVGTFWGVGDGLTTANAPDLRGRFRRMVDLTSVGQASRDPDHASRTPAGTGTTEEPGSIQGDEFRSHTHRVGQQAGGSGAPTWQSSGDSPNNQQSGAAGGNETRPLNAYVIVMIKT